MAIHYAVGLFILFRNEVFSPVLIIAQDEEDIFNRLPWRGASELE